ncbi:7-cyano-7-deazaguanine synthase [Methanomicrobium sp. W14]|uniref:7-cyano-7-deazaguanine synthase QueC n=1 Tax=Methanomicrobium sp. W14 TaxID=2817839 RepID=UPI001AEB2480|nr:7-cyano-7-deazaguanine synthase QueC [Methanomicrobium sp. W14]MBP2133840.1 7-cyano-7-deazaguanine synthase [Methanomicrobium sp. W14]
MKAVCLMSGGMDSSTLAYFAKDMGYDILALHTRYGQRTEEKELECAKKIAKSLNAPEFMEISLSYLTKFGGSSLTDNSMTVFDHSDETDEKKIPNTYVPFRNSNLLSIATSYAESRGAEAIFIGVQASDYAGYPDCRPEFVEAFQKVIDLGTSDETHIKLMTPFVNLNKTEILKIGMKLGVPYKDTWSCYKSNFPACGKCDSCYYRLKAFEEIGVEDPIEYMK